MSKLGRMWLLGLCLLTACQTNDWPTTPETNGEHIAFKIQYDDRFENDSVALSKTETGTYLNTKYDHVELIVSNPNGTVVEGLKGLYDSVTSEVRISGLQAGEYQLLVLGVKGEMTADKAQFNSIKNLNEEWLTFFRPT